MPFVSKPQDGEEHSADVAAGGPPSPGIDFDPHDPDAVKVHYDLAGWTFEQRAELAETLAEHAIPHGWDGDELVVPEELEGVLDVLFEQLEAEIGPFPVGLAADDPSIEYGLDEWPERDLTILREALVDAEIPHRWEGSTLLVADDADEAVDEMLDAIETGDVSVLDQAAPDGVLNELYAATARLARDPSHVGARKELERWAGELDPAAPPFGMALHVWTSLLSRVVDLDQRYADGDEASDLSAAAAAARDQLQQWV